MNSVNFFGKTKFFESIINGIESDQIWNMAKRRVSVGSFFDLLTLAVKTIQRFD